MFDARIFLRKTTTDTFVLKYYAMLKSALCC